ncbi:putative N6-adenine methyltransferase-domain-containing protein [Hyaloraphidium curvatum]|nr:putative N6-adenine methyltransferase-domain-containing protein [Hyaloraphidium curvatum]
MDADSRIADAGSDDEPPSLPADTLAALASFLSEKEQSERRFAELQAAAEAGFAARAGIEDFAEDYQLSQFWYDVPTREALAGECLAAHQGTVGFLSTPGPYFAYKRAGGGEAVLFEYDARFAVGAGDEFVRYDYAEPNALPERCRGAMDMLVVDPPFLSEECWLRFALAIRLLSAPGAKILVCTGAVMKPFLARILPQLRVTRFRPAHEGGRLSNDFICLANYESADPRFAFEDGAEADE